MNPLAELQPRIVWKHFADICAIPHPSRHEEALARHVEGLADRLGLEHQRDRAGNLIIRKPASAGCESAPGIVLQAHLDMVPQKAEGSDHDFTRDPIRPRVVDGWVTATGTTLGADNGIGVAVILALLESDDLRHGPLEALLTINEEAGMDGAKGLEPGLLEGSLLLNLDSEDEGELFIGCAGGIDATFTLPVRRQQKAAAGAVRVRIGGLLGGHSGCDIHLPRANANQLLGALIRKAGGELIELEGGSLRNAIPRHAEALLTADDLEALESHLRRESQRLTDQWLGREPGLHIEISRHPAPALPALTDASHQNLLRLLCNCPNGVWRWDEQMEGVVETSNNVARALLGEEEFELGCLVRSAREAARGELCAELERLAERLEARIEFSGAYPGWTPNPDSELLKRVNRVHEQVTGKPAKIKVIHAGLECGLLGAVYPHWEMISFGPTIRYPHSPGEKVEIASVERFWTLIRAVLEDLAA